MTATLLLGTETSLRLGALHNPSESIDPSTTAVELPGPETFIFKATGTLSDVRDGSSSSAPISPKRRSVDEEAGLVEDHQELAEQVGDKTRLVRLNADGHGEIAIGSRPVAAVAPPQYPASEPRPPPSFSSLYVAPPDAEAVASVLESFPALKSPFAALAVGEEVEEVPSSSSAAAPSYAVSVVGVAQSEPSSSSNTSGSRLEDETKRALPPDTKRGSSRTHKDDDLEPPPAYSEGPSPLQTFTYLMAAAGGASSIITQVQQGGPPINALGGTCNP